MTNRFAKVVLSLIIGAILVTVMFSCTQTTSTATTKNVTDMTGRVVTIPVKVDRVACLVGPSYDAVFMLGGASKIVLGMSQSNWAKVLNPATTQISKVSNAQNPNVEELMAKNVQAVFFWDYPDPTKAMTDAGIPVIATLAAQSNPPSLDEWLKAQKDSIRLYANVLGESYKAKAEAYCKYYDDTVKRITAVTNKIPDNQRPRVYYLGHGYLNVTGEFSNTRWLVQMAGGNYVSKELKTNTVADVSIEQVTTWNPDYIFLGTFTDIAKITGDPQWSGINAVKNDKVYLSPQGEFKWDYGVETPLLIMYMAKTFYPDKFTDINMVKELKSFYSQFFNYSLTDNQANLILNHQDPQ
jgi:iron complex transport system substrate-binding protein